MPERLSIGQIYSQATSNLARNYQRLFRSQGQLMTGKQILRPSDGAAQTGRLFGLMRQEKNLDRYLETVDLALSQVDSGASGLQQISDMVQRARELGIQGANGALGTSDRASVGTEIKELIEAIVSAANAQVEDRFLFGGTETARPPFEIVRGADGLERVVYHGNQEALEVEIGPGVRAALNISGNRIFAAGPRSATIFSGGTGAVPGAGTDSGVGRGRLLVAHERTAYGSTSTPGGADVGTGLAPGALSASGDTILGPGHTITLESNALGNGTISLNGGPQVVFTSADTNLQVTGPGGEVIYVDTTTIAPNLPPTVVSVNATGTLSLDGGQTHTAIDFTNANQQVVSQDSGAVLHVDATNISLAGTEEVTYGGTATLFDALLSMRDTLLDTSLDNETSNNDVRAALGLMDRGHTDMLSAMSELGARHGRFEAAGTRLDDLGITIAELRSNIEDADIAEVTMDISRYQALYQASLLMASRINELSLLNYI